MPRPNPLNRRLPRGWKEETLKILEMSACPKGSANLPVVNRILAHEKAGEAIRFLKMACEKSGHPRPFLLYKIVLNLAFVACVGARTYELLRQKNISKEQETSKTLIRLFQDAMVIAEQNPLDKFSIYDRAKAIVPTFELPRLDNATVLNSLGIAYALVGAITYQPKRHKTGRPIDGWRKTLDIHLKKMFREHLGSQVTGAVKCLVAATFPGKEE